MSKTMSVIDFAYSEFCKLYAFPIPIVSDYELEMKYSSAEERTYVGKFGKYRGFSFIQSINWLSYPHAALLYHETFLPYAAKRGYL